MKFYCFLEKTLQNLINFCWKSFIQIHEIKNIIKKRKIYKNVILTKEQKKQIDDFYKTNYGKKIPYNWHRLYQSYTGKFDYKYIPEYIFSTKLELISNKRNDIIPLENKSILDTIVSNVDKIVTTPKNYLMNINGTFFDESKNIISKAEAINILNSKYSESVIKVSKDSNSGKGVKILHIKNGIDQNTNLSTENIFKLMGNNFVVQEKIKQHKNINKIYPNSINTLRVVSYITSKGYMIAPIILRIGKDGNELDNAHAGGIFIAVDNSGKLHQYAFSEYGKKYEKHPNTQFKFKDFEIPLMKELKETIIKLHKKLPTIKFISWDLAINDDNKIVIVEANLHSQAVWVSQMAHGASFFQENTAEMLQKLRK